MEQKTWCCKRCGMHWQAGGHAVARIIGALIITALSLLSLLAGFPCCIGGFFFWAMFMYAFFGSPNCPNCKCNETFPLVRQI